MDAMISGFWLDYTCAAISCLVAGSYFIAQLRDQTPPPRFLGALSAIILVGILWIAIVRL